jgi:dethiobiotin synthetase
VSRCLIVTGTDTGIGKTRVACALLLAARRRGLRAAGYKPVASGCEQTAQGLRNEDAEALLAASAPGLRYEDVNPYAFEPPIAPHLAAAEAGRRIEPERLSAGLDALRAGHDLVVVEGAGGWRVPLVASDEADIDFADWASSRGQILLVVGLRLGCLNHALLSAESIARRAPLAGWVANQLPDAGPQAEAMVATLSRTLGAPLLTVGCGERAAAASRRVPDRLLG